MTRFLALVALGLAMTLAPTPGKAQVPDGWGLLDQNQTNDLFITQEDFNLAPGNRQPTRDCIQSIRRLNYGGLPQLDRNRLDRLDRLASGQNAGRVPTFGGSSCARDEFRVRNPNLSIGAAPSPCPSPP